MTALDEALARLLAAPDPFATDLPPETVDEVFASGGDAHKRFNSDWRRALAAERESKEGSP